MENASKALIIAGAILLSILLISLGIMIYNQAADTVNNTNMDGTSITTFNGQFTKYEGANVKGSQVKSLIAEVNANNGNVTMQDARYGVTVNGLDKTDSSSDDFPIYLNKIDGDTDTIKNSGTYTVEVTGYSDEGRVNEMSVTKNP